MGYTGGLEIAYQRWKKHISQEELAREIGYSQAAVALWESGKRTPSITAMIKMADYFDVSLDKFIERRTPDNTIGLAYSGRIEDHPFYFPHCMPKTLNLLVFSAFSFCRRYWNDTIPPENISA